ncbi:sodium:solute symporter [Deltaproteobacteria bacterium]|nr:sodium:solute symporter [Deltaproteobacteria bacterium]
MACLALACCYAKPLHESGISTMPQMLSKEYGKNVATVAMVLTSIGSFLSIVAQVLSSVSLVTSVSSMHSVLATGLTVVLMIFYVFFGGIWGTGLVGVAKTLLLCITVGICGIMAFYWQGGWSAFTVVLPSKQYFNLMARGPAVDVGAGLSVALGVITTQTYIQALISARTVRLARAGALISAALIPLIGIAGIFVGLYMKINAPDIDPAKALPIFILQHLPPLFGGVVMATILITVIGTAAGVSLGISSMFCNDIYRVYFNPQASDRMLLKVSRVTLASILVCAALVTTGNLGSMILNWSFLSMGFRGAVAFGVLTAAIFIPGRIDRKYAMWSMVVGPLCILIGKPFIGNMIDPLFFGVAGSLIVLAIGFFRNKNYQIS